MANDIPSSSNFLKKLLQTSTEGNMAHMTFSSIDSRLGPLDIINTTHADSLLNIISTAVNGTLKKITTPLSVEKPLPLCADILNSGTTEVPESGEYIGSDVSALLYIVIVLGFYAFAMVVMMVAYVRRENQEAEFSHYFTEFIKRDRFETARYQNRQKRESVQKALKALYKPAVYKETGVWKHCNVEYCF